MTGLEWTEPPPRAELVAGIRKALGTLGSSLRVLAQDVLGAEARIDLVAADPEGRVHLVLVSTGGDDLALVALALAQRAWLEARLPDWIQLAPRLGLRSEGPLRVILVAADFSAPAVAAARAADPEEIDLVRFRCVRREGETEILLEPRRLGGIGEAPGAGLAPRRAGQPPAAARFRTGLSDGDLLLTPDERRGLD